MNALADTGIRIEPLSGLDDLDAAVEIQKAIWGYADVEVDSRALLVIASRFIGSLLGAFEGDALVGMALAFHTASPERLHSHRVGVLREYQNRGIGRALKLAQREQAMAQGVRVIQWTFDPLQPRNAHFNLVRLGAIGRSYLPNLYGASSSPLHGRLPTDRLLLEWHVESPRVGAILHGEEYRPGADSVQIQLPPRGERSHPDHQEKLRHSMEDKLAAGYAVTGFYSNNQQDFYTLEML